MNLSDAIPHGFDMMVYEVEAGTEIEHNGERMTVTDTVVVQVDNKLYCTARVFQAIKERTAKRLS